MRIYLPFLLLVFIISCGEAEESEEEKEAVFVSETILIKDTIVPLDSKAVEIMEDLRMCTTLDTVLELPPCEAEFYRTFQYKNEEDIREGFMVEMVPGLFGSRVHQLIIIDNLDGKYSIVNQYMGMLLEMRTQKSGYNDLLIAYEDPTVGTVAIRHEWQGKKYQPIDVEEINNHFVKPEMKDSINAIFIPAFNAGH